MKNSKIILRKVIIYAIAACCIAWVVSGVNFEELFSHIHRMNPWWILSAVILDVFTTVLHGIRWRFLLQPLARLSLLRTVQAIYTGLFTNEILPVKAGEFVRGYLISRWVKVAFASVLPSIITERVFDGFILVIGFGLSTFFVTLPQAVVTAAGIMAAVLLFALFLFAVIGFKRRKFSGTIQSASTKKRGIVQHIAAFSSQFAGGLRLIKTSARLLTVLGASVLYLFTQVLAYWSVMKAYGIHFPIWVPAVTLIIVRLGTALPNAPANIGPFQFFCVLALTMFGVEKTTATGFAIVLWLVFSIPIFLLGSFAFLKSGLTWAEIHASSSNQ
jgi:uncharacterized protein (TIRG00374 family)